MNATPQRAKSDKADAPLLSRLEQMRKDRKDTEYEPDMPQVEVAGYLIGYLFEVGPTMDSGPITHEELRAWQANIGVTLHPWEIRVLRRLSCDYLSESQKATKPDHPAPWNTDLSIAWKSVKKLFRDLANT